MEMKRTYQEMQLPAAGQQVPKEVLLALCHYYEKLDIIEALERNGWPEQEFVSDGCSMWPDSWRGRDIYKACFWHDMRYWAGLPGDEVARLIADAELAKDVAVMASPDLARTMFVGIGFGGTDKIHTPFRWGYGRG